MFLDHLERYLSISNSQTYERFQIEYQRWICALLDLLGSVKDTHPLADYVSLDQPFLSLWFLAHRVKPDEMIHDWLPRQQHLQHHPHPLWLDGKVKDQTISRLEHELHIAQSKNQEVIIAHRECEGSLDGTLRQLKRTEEQLKVMTTHYDMCLQTKRELERLFLMTLRSSSSQSSATTFSHASSIDQRYINQLHHTMEIQEHQFKRLEGEEGSSNPSLVEEEEASPPNSRQRFPNDEQAAKREQTAKQVAKTSTFSLPLVVQSNLPSNLPLLGITRAHNNNDTLPEAPSTTTTPLAVVSPVTRQQQQMTLTEEDVKEWKETIRHLEHALHYHTYQLEEQTETNQSLTQTALHLQNQNMNYVKQITDLETDLDRMTRMNQVLREKDICSSKTIQFFHSEIKEFQKQIQAKESLLAEVEREKEIRQTHDDSKQDTLRENKDTLRGLQDTLRENKDTLRGLQDTIDSQTHHYETMIADYLTQVTLLTSQRNELRVHVNHVNTQLTTLTASQTQEKCELVRMTKEVNAYSEFFTSLIVYFELMHSDTPSEEDNTSLFLTSIYESIKKIHGDLITEHASLRLNYQLLQTELKHTYSAIETLQSDLSSYKNALRGSPPPLDSDDERRSENRGGKTVQDEGTQTHDELLQNVKRLTTDKENRDRMKLFKKRLRQKREENHPISQMVERLNHTLQTCRQESSALRRELFDTKRKWEKEVKELKRKQLQELPVEEVPSRPAASGVSDLEATVTYYQSFFKYLEGVFSQSKRAKTVSDFQLIYDDLHTWYTRMVHHELSTWWTDFEAILKQPVAEQSGQANRQSVVGTRAQLEQAEFMMVKQECQEQQQNHMHHLRLVTELKQLMNLQESAGEEAILSLLKHVSSLFTGKGFTDYMAVFETHVKESIQIDYLDKLLTMAGIHFKADHLSDMYEKAIQVETVLTAFGSSFLDALKKVHTHLDLKDPNNDSSIHYFVSHIDLTNGSHVIKFLRALQITIKIFKLSEEKEYPTTLEMEQTFITHLAKSILKSERSVQLEPNMSLWSLLELYPPPRKVAKRSSNRADTSDVEAMEDGSQEH